MISDTRNGIELDLYLSQIVPYRVFTLDDPRRLVLDFKEADWQGVDPTRLDQSEAALAVRFGVLRPGWSRLVVDLGGPFALETSDLMRNSADGTAHLSVRLSGVSGEEYSLKSGFPSDDGWTFTARASNPETDPANDRLIVAIDPGHGGVDPGAQRGGVNEADLMLVLGLELSEALTRAGVQNILTRNSDVFVPLEERMTIARASGADLFLSLHADALEGVQTSGASIYTLNQDAQDSASDRMAERHDRADLIVGLDLSDQDDTIATILMDLARLETEPQTARLAGALVQGLERQGAPMNSRPRREANLAVLNAPDFASVLVEVGFLSNASDRERLLSPDGRARIIEGLVAGIQIWDQQEQSLAPLVRQ